MTTDMVNSITRRSKMQPIKAVAWPLMIAIALNAGLAQPAFASDDLIPGSAGNPGQIPANRGINDTSEWYELDVDKPSAGEHREGTGNPFTQGPTSPIQGSLPAAQNLLNPVSTPLFGSNPLFFNLALIITPSGLPAFAVATGTPFSRASDAFGLLSPTLTPSRPQLDIPNIQVPESVRIISNDALIGRWNSSLIAQQRVTSSPPVGPNRGLDQGPFLQWPLGLHDLRIAWSQLVNASRVSAGSPAVEIGDGRNNDGRAGSSSSPMTILGLWGPGGFVANGEPILATVFIANPMDPTNQSKFIRRLSAWIAKTLSSIFKGGHGSVNTQGSKPAATDNSTRSVPGRDGMSQANDLIRNTATAAVTGGLRSFGSVLNAGLILAVEMMMTAGRFLSTIAPDFDATSIFMRLREGLFRLEKLLEESAKTRTPTDNTPPETRAVHADQTPGRGLALALRSLWKELQALRAGVHMTAGDAHPSDSAANSAEKADPALDAARSDSYGPASMTTNTLKSLLEEQGSIKFKHTPATILVGKLLKAVKAAAEFGMTYRFDPSGLGMFVTGTLS